MTHASDTAKLFLRHTLTLICVSTVAGVVMAAPILVLRGVIWLDAQGYGQLAILGALVVFMAAMWTYDDIKERKR